MFEKIINKCVSILPKKLQDIYYKYEDALLYIFFGGLTTLVSMAAQFGAACIVGFSGTVPNIIASTFSWICAVTFAFFTNKKYVFKSETSTKKDFLRQFLMFYSARGVSYFMQLGIMVLGDKLLNYDIKGWYVLAYVISQVVVLVANYALSKLVIFRKKQED